MSQTGREKLEKNIARNIALLRKHTGMTQAGLAEKIGYSDKSVSKWERGEGIPDVICLWQMAELFGVTVDTLLADEPVLPGEVPETIVQTEAKPAYGVNRWAIVLLSMAGVWLLAALAFIIVKLAVGDSALPFVIALPVTMLLAVIFNSIWGTRKWAFPVITVFVWCILFLICWICRRYNIWLLMTLGIPAAVIVWLSCRVRRVVAPADDGTGGAE
ncbi:MAG: helix-turn-helix transcriptional regulator [Clostridia bacterium]|nr:helix-turn-helix transcriptional regulator [Clostridia bacterium]